MYSKPLTPQLNPKTYTSYRLTIVRARKLRNRATRTAASVTKLPALNNKLVWKTNPWRFKSHLLTKPNNIIKRSWENVLVFMPKIKSVAATNQCKAITNVAPSFAYENDRRTVVGCLISWPKFRNNTKITVQRPLALNNFALASNYENHRLNSISNGFYLPSSFATAPKQLLYRRWFYQLSRAVYFFLFLRLKYKGKSFKWFKKKGSIVLRFGHSHSVVVKVPQHISSKKRKRMRIIFFGTCRWELRRFMSILVKWRPMNVYNGRGIRFARQLVFRKSGKVSAYR